MNSWDLYLHQSDSVSQNQTETQQSFDFNFSSVKKESKKTSGKTVERASKKVQRKNVKAQPTGDVKFTKIDEKNTKVDCELKLQPKSRQIKVYSKIIESVLPFNAWSIGELSEIRCKKDENIFHLLLPLLSELSAQNRWITLIAPPAGIDKKLFAYHGIDVSRVLLIHPKESLDDTSTMNKALKNGTSGIVLIWVESLAARFVAQWRKSVKQGGCRGVIINHDLSEHSSPSVALSLEVSSSDDAITITSSQMFGRKSNYKSKRSFPIINMEDDNSPNRVEMGGFCLVN